MASQLLNRAERARAVDAVQSQNVTALLLLFFALVVAIALSAPVNWFVRRGMGRHWAAILTLLLFFGALILLGALVIVSAWGLIWIYVRWANSHYDTTVASLKEQRR